MGKPGAVCKDVLVYFCHGTLGPLYFILIFFSFYFDLISLFLG